MSHPLFTRLLISTLTLSSVVAINTFSKAQTPPAPSTPLSQLTPADVDIEATREAYIPDDVLISPKAQVQRRGIIGQDERVEMTSQDFPWSAIGRLEIMTDRDRIKSCTGSLIAPKLVLTNAHCIINKTDHSVHSKIKFQPNLIDNQVETDDVAHAVSAAYGTDFSGDESRLYYRSHDWAILEIDKPLGETYGTLGYETFDGEYLKQFPGKYIVVGYSGDFPEENPGKTASAHYNCDITGEREEVLVHHCDTMAGASGSPVLVIEDDQVKIVALHAGWVRYEDGRAENEAVKLSRIDEWFASWWES